MRARSRQRYANTSLAHGALVTSALVASAGATFDVFLSHSSLDAESIIGLKLVLEDEGLSVYVDSIFDSQLDRNSVTVETATLLRQRMDQSRFLVLATSHASPQSKWIPWELGYFDGSKPEKVGIVPLVQSPNASFAGQEYLSLYPAYEVLDFEEYGPRLGRPIDEQTGQLLIDAVHD